MQSTSFAVGIEAEFPLAFFLDHDNDQIARLCSIDDDTGALLGTQFSDDGPFEFSDTFDWSAAVDIDGVAWEAVMTWKFTEVRDGSTLCGEVLDGSLRNPASGERLVLDGAALAAEPWTARSAPILTRCAQLRTKDTDERSKELNAFHLGVLTFPLKVGSLKALLWTTRASQSAPSGTNTSGVCRVPHSFVHSDERLCPCTRAAVHSSVGRTRTRTRTTGGAPPLARQDVRAVQYRCRRCGLGW